MLAVCALTGGSYQFDAPGLLVLRPVCILAIAALLLLPGRRDWSALRPLIWMLAAFAALMALQLIPLPPAIWAQLPGHARFVLPVDGQDAWRPLSLSPDLTINAMMALLPTATVLVAYAAMNATDRNRLTWVVIALCLISALWAVLQQLVAADSPLFIYGQGEDGLPTGLLANRNHQAVLLSCALPYVAVVATDRHKSAAWVGPLCAAVAILMIPAVILTGSRSGTLALVLAVAVAASIVWVRRGHRMSGASPFLRPRYVVPAALAATAVLIFVLIDSGRALSISRTFDSSLSNELRVRSFPVMMQIARDFLPFGFGFGGFDHVFRSYEPDSLLVATYMNRAHNDLLETVMSGGVPALALVATLLAWLVRAAVRLSKIRGDDSDRMLKWASLTVIALWLLASLSDYPLRTGLVSMVFAMACCQLAGARVPAIAQRAQRDRKKVKERVLDGGR